MGPSTAAAGGCLDWPPPPRLLTSLAGVGVQGEEAATRLTIPRLRVRRDWHKGLNPDPNDHRCVAVSVCVVYACMEGWGITGAWRCSISLLCVCLYGGVG